MWLGLDDTDSKSEGCTTYVAFEIVSRFSKIIHSFPRLVRLNPNLKYKTRGNGGLSMKISYVDSPSSHRIGNYHGNPVYVNSTNNECDIKKEFELHKEHLISEFEGIVREFSVKDDLNTNPGIVLSRDGFDEEIYRNALNREIKISDIKKLLECRSDAYRFMGNGRGLIGSVASISWKPKRHTYELLNYKYPHASHVDDTVKHAIAEIAESFTSTFNNLEMEENKVCLFPVERTPVVYGIRGTSYEDLKTIQDEISSKFPEFSKNYMIFQSNQGTDDHILKLNPSEDLKELSSYELEGVVVGNPIRLRGGHLHATIKIPERTVDIIAFEPSKSFRDKVETLRRGDFIRVYGSYSAGSIKIEKLELIFPANIFERTSPRCDLCNGKTLNVGSLKYKCATCGNVQDPLYIHINREIEEYKIEPPVYSRRHLSMPWKLENVQLECDTK
jgi:tRNA(Ile2)-agmatinylcytidine synthase